MTIFKDYVHGHIVFKQKSHYFGPMLVEVFFVTPCEEWLNFFAKLFLFFF